MIHRLLLLVAFLSTSPGEARGQVSSHPDDWLVSAYGGAALGTATGDIADALRAGGFDEPWGCFPFCTTTTYPRRVFPGPSFMLAVRRHAGDHVHIRATLGSLRVAKVWGHKTFFVPLRERLRGVSLSVGWNARSRQGAWVAAGPAFYRAALDGGIPDERRRTAWRAGGTLAAGWMTSFDWAMVEIQAFYTFLGHAPSAPINVTGELPYSVGVVPAMQSGLSHGGVMLGLGRAF